MNLERTSGRVRYSLICSLLVMLLCISFILLPGSRARAQVTSSWTVMVYLDADNNLETYGVTNFLQMAESAEGGPGPNEVNVLVQMDRYVGEGGYGGWTDTKRFEVFHDSTPVETDPGFVSDLGELDMGNPATLTDFVSWGKSYRPADRYMVVLWNHGSGWKEPSQERKFKGICYDDTNGGNHIDMKGLDSSLDIITDHGQDKIDLLTFDACLMGMAEIDYQIMPYCNERTGSEETEPGTGIPYDTVIEDLVANPAMDEAELGSTVVDRYYEFYPDGQECAAVDLSKSADVAGAVDSLSRDLLSVWEQEYPAIWAAAYAGEHYAYWDFIDLYRFAEILKAGTSDTTLQEECQSVMDAVDAAVTNEKHGPYWANSHGISIYFATSLNTYNSKYDGDRGLLMFTADTQWAVFQRAFLGGPTSNIAAAINGGKVVDFSSEIGDFAPASNLIDGGAACWSPEENVAGNFVTVELAGGRPAPLGTILIDPGPIAGGTALAGFHLQSSLDGNTYKDILSGTFGPEDNNYLNRFDLSGTGERARFLRIVVDSSQDTSPYASVAVAELQVYGATIQAGGPFYFAEGTTRPDFDSYLTIANISNAAANVRITYMKGDGTQKVQSLSVAPSSRATVHPADLLGVGDDPAHDFSAKVESTNGVGIVAERPMYFDYQGKWTGGSDVVGASAPASDWYFAEGTCRKGFDTYLSVCNPDTNPATVKATYMKGDGTSAFQNMTVAPGSRGTLHPSDVLGTGDDLAHDFSAKVESTNGVGIVAERPMYFDYQGKWTGGSDVVGANFPASNWYFAEGSCRTNFEPYICILNPGGDTADIRITYMKGNGTTQEQTASVPARARATIPVSSVLGTGDDPAHDFSAQVTCTNGDVICERPTYFDYQGKWDGGFDVMGATMASSTCYFAEGSCRPGFDAYLCVQNPGNTAASVQVTYMKGDSTTAVQATTVPARSRATLHPADVLGVGNDSAHDFAATVTCDTCQQIIVERPMYFDYQSKWTGGSDVLGYVPGQ